MRLLLAGLVLAVAVAGAVWLHSYQQTRCRTATLEELPLDRVCHERHPGWADPLAAGALVLALAAAAAFIAKR